MRCGSYTPLGEAALTSLGDERTRFQASSPAPQDVLPLSAVCGFLPENLASASRFLNSEERDSFSMFYNFFTLCKVATELRVFCALETFMVRAFYQWQRTLSMAAYSINGSVLRPDRRRPSAFHPRTRVRP